MIFHSHPDLLSKPVLGPEIWTHCRHHGLVPSWDSHFFPPHSNRRLPDDFSWRVKQECLEMQKTRVKDTKKLKRNPQEISICQFLRDKCIDIRYKRTQSLQQWAENNDLILWLTQEACYLNTAIYFEQTDRYGTSCVHISIHLVRDLRAVLCPTSSMAV